MDVIPYHEAVMCAAAYVHWFGLSVIPIGAAKKPSIKWKMFQERHPTMEEILSWPKEGFNLAVVTGEVSGGLVIVDCESREDAEWFWTQKSQTNTIVQTKRGFHFYFRSSDEVRNAQRCFDRYDVRGEGGYALIPPSRHYDGQYAWRKRIVDVALLPEFNREWRPDPPVHSYDERRITDGKAYIAKIEAIEGEGGDSATYRAAIALRDSGLSEGEAMYCMMEWNTTNARPPWTPRELLHKVVCAYNSDRVTAKGLA